MQSKPKKVDTLFPRIALFEKKRATARFGPMTYIGDANDAATILADADIFFSQSGYFADTDPNEVLSIQTDFASALASHASPPFWGRGQQIFALVQVYDLVLPVSLDKALVYLTRLSAMADAFLVNRDDFSGAPADPFRSRVMAAWGCITPNRDGKWNTDVDTSGLLLYCITAFARRVVDRPHLYPQFHNQAIALISAALDTYLSFRPELHLTDADPFAYFKFPKAYGNLQCDNGASGCDFYHDRADHALPYNQSLSMFKALAELALAASSSLYRSSPGATALRLQLATEEIPLAIAKNIAFRNANLRPKSLPDLTPYYEWDYEQNGDVEDIGHAQFELGCLSVILEDQVRLDALLAAAGRSERVPLNPSMFVRFANTFLRIIWRNNVLSKQIDGSGDTGFNSECTGWIPLAQFDPWVWRRSRDTVFANDNSLVVGNHAALLRYRGYNSMRYLTDFAGQNWLITPAALAVGEPAPASIHDQKWLIVLSGVVIANQRGDNSGQWNYQTVSFIPDMSGPDDPSATSGPLNWAISKYSIPRPPGAVGSDYTIRFSLEEWSPFVSLGSIFDQGQSINAGFAVDDWRPNHFDNGTSVLTGQPVNNIFTGVNADLAVQDSDAWLYRLSYNITLLGKIVFMAPPIIY
jgi:hypothetical protein